MTRAEMQRGVMGKYAPAGSAPKHRFVELDLDVAGKFRSAQEVNEALRLVQKMREIGKPARKKRTAQ